VSDMGSLIVEEARRLIEINGARQRYFSVNIEIPRVKHKVRVVILWEGKKGKEAVKILATNKIFWSVSRIIRVYRKRWVGTERFHGDGKQNLGMGECQL